jgi:heme o synthase
MTPRSRGWSGGRIGTLIPLRTFAALTKFPISALATLTCASGYICATRKVDAGIIPLVSGVLLLAFGACALNQFQDRRFDARMPRTRNRPIPAGALAPSTALAISGFFTVAGFWILLLGSGALPALLGIGSAVWYNAVYTYLKRLTAFAVVPGALVGAIPPVIGWTAGGGGVADSQSIALAFFFFVWQVPHFWYLVSFHGLEYERAGLPSLSQALSLTGLSRLTFVWTCTAGVSALLLPLFRVVSAPSTRLAMAGAGALLCASAIRTLLRPGPESARRAFWGINLYGLAVCALLAADPALSR